MSIDASANIYFDCIREDFIKNFQKKSGIFTEGKIFNEVFPKWFSKIYTYALRDPSPSICTITYEHTDCATDWPRLLEMLPHLTRDD